MKDWGGNHPFFLASRLVPTPRFRLGGIQRPLFRTKRAMINGGVLVDAWPEICESFAGCDPIKQRPSSVVATLARALQFNGIRSVDCIKLVSDICTMIGLNLILNENDRFQGENNDVSYTYIRA